MLRPKIHNAMELEALVRWIDFLPVLSVPSAISPSRNLPSAAVDL